MGCHTFVLKQGLPFYQINSSVLMENLCDRAIRCLCSCLIKKDAVHFTEVSDEHKQFMNVNEHLEDEPKNMLASGRELSNKFSDYLQEGQPQPMKAQKNTSLMQPSKESFGSTEEESFLKEEEFIGKDYTDVMDPQHPYYQLFKDKLAKLSVAFDIPENASRADPDTSYPLTLYCYNQGKYNVFVYFFKFPSDVDTYESISNDFELQKKFDSNIDEFKKQYEVVGGDAKLIYLSYKKVLMMSSRDFQYVKYSFKKDKEWWSICASDLSREEVKDKVRGDMVLSATRIVEVEGEIQVSVYSQTDMKIPIKLEIAKNRGFAEIRKYLDKVYNHIQSAEKDIF